MKIDIKELLYKITENKAVYEDVDFIDSDILDSYAIIMLINALEDLGIIIDLREAHSDSFRNIEGIEQLMPWSEFIKEHCSGLIDVETVTVENHPELPIQKNHSDG